MFLNLVELSYVESSVIQFFDICTVEGLEFVIMPLISLENRIQLVQELKPTDHSQRCRFADWISKHGAGFSEKIIFTDEAHFASQILRFNAVRLLQDNVYKNNPQTIQELKTNIEDVIREIDPQLCRNVIENFVKRIEVCNIVVVDICLILFFTHKFSSLYIIFQ